MPAKEYLGWLRNYDLEPWGNKEAGLRTGLLAMASSEIEGIDPEMFVISEPTKREQAEHEEWQKQSAEFEAMGRKRRAEKD